MTENEQKYTDYVKDLSKVRVTMLSLLAGFTFSTITILLNQLPDPQSFPSQGTLLFLTVMFNLLLFLLMWQMVIVVGLYDVRRPPPRSVWELTMFNAILTGVFVMWGYSLPLIFLLWSLPSLALVSGITWTAVVAIYGHAARSIMRRLGWSFVEEVKKARTRA